MEDQSSQTLPRLKPLPKPPAMWTVLFFDDKFTPMIFVVDVLMRIFNQTQSNADAIAIKIDSEGKATVGRFQKDIAYLKADQTTTLAREFRYPLRVLPIELLN